MRPSPTVAISDRTSRLLSSQVLHAIFTEQADTQPHALAVVFGREEITYAELESRANRLARHLRRHGLGRGSVVAMLLPRSIDAYATQLGILKAGAAYLPIDPEYPPERIAYILRDSAAGGLVTTTDLAARHTFFSGVVIRTDADCDAIAGESSARLGPDEVDVGPQDLCYIIYTSGSTGRPKGVMIEHRSAWHLVRAEGSIYQLQPEDRVYQGASLSFDLSVEEIWVAFQAGATLIPAPPEVARAEPDLWRFLREQGVTVLSTVPTLLSMLAEDVPSLRLIILGGEVCPDHLVARWSRPGRRMVNTYGPTETTVIATCADLSPGTPVTIGRAIPGYRIYLLDERLQPVRQGQPGEICISGPGVARGYMGLSEETRLRFLPDPFAPAADEDSRMYRTGDLGRIDANGNIEFLGRADGQVKLRGFRVELAEIEAVLLEADGLLAAACAVCEAVPGIQQLGAYVVTRDGRQLEEERLRLHLRNRLPLYMVPSWIETVRELPRLPSGKLDRASLPPPRSRQSVPDAPRRGRPNSVAEQQIAAVWEALFYPQPVSIHDHFFLDLGGHSLLAARMVSELRRDSRFASVSVTDLYEHPTIASLASFLDSVPRSQPAQKPPAATPEGCRPGEQQRHFIGGLVQTAALYFAFGFRASEWVTPYLVYFLLAADGRSNLERVTGAAVSTMVVFPLLAIIAVAAKWLLIGRIRPGRYPLWGVYYLRWWFVQNLISALPLQFLAGTPLLPFIYRLLGARIGRDVHIGTYHLAAFDLISIGEGASIDEAAWLLGSTVRNRELVIAPVHIGRGCFVGTGSVLREDTVMEDGARLEDLSLLPTGGRILRDETWGGSPAHRVTSPKVVHRARPVRGPWRRVATAALYAVLLLVIPVLHLGAFLPGVAILTHIDLYAQPLLYLAALPVAGACFVFVLTASLVLFKWLLVGRVRAGTYPVHGSFYIRKWIVDQLLTLSLDVVGSLHATLYLPLWYRAMGARLGRFVELSTATSMTPDLLDIGDGCTIADEASLGAARIEGGWLTLAPTRLGRRVFVGNSAVIPPGTSLGEESLVGVLSMAPNDLDQAAERGASWLGSPPIRLPRRQASALFPEQKRFCPSRKLCLLRGAVEMLRISFPPAGFIFVTTTVVASAIELWDRLGPSRALMLLPLVYGVSCIGVALAVVLAKWTIMGRFRPFERPLWSQFVWRLEFVNALYEFMVTPLMLDALQGTPLLPWYFRLLGARIGRRTYFHTTGIIEFDLVEVGDEAVVNDDSVLQSHLFEDRVLKASALRIGRRCEVGAVSVILYDSQMEDGAQLDALSLLMKGERLPAGTAWAGSPARRHIETHECPTGAAA